MKNKMVLLTSLQTEVSKGVQLMLSNQNTEIIDHRTVRQFILDEIPLTDSAEITEAVKLSIFSSIFYHTIHAFKTIAIKTLAPLLAFVSLIGFAHEYFSSLREQNNNKKPKHFLNGLLLIAEVIAIFFFVTGTLVSTVVAPAIFVAVSATRFLMALVKSLYYVGELASLYYNKWFKDNDETFTQKHKHAIDKLKLHLKDTLIGGIVCAGIIIAFFAPEVVGFPAIVAPVVLAFKWMACVTLGALSSWILTRQSIKNFFKSRTTQESSTQITEEPKNDSMTEPLIQPQPSFKLSDNLHFTDEIKEKYRKNKFNHLMHSDVDDLLIKMEVLHEEKTEGTNLLDLEYLDTLIQQEKMRIQLGNNEFIMAQKMKVLNLLEALIAGKNLNLRCNGVSYENSVLGITRYFCDQEALKPMLTSYFREVGGMQKIFLLVDHYCKLNPEILFKAKIDTQVAESESEKLQQLKNEVLTFKNDAKKLTYELQGSVKTIDKATIDIKNHKKTIQNQQMIIKNLESKLNVLKSKDTEKGATALVKNSIYYNPFAIPMQEPKILGYRLPTSSCD